MSASESCDSIVVTRLSLLGGTGAARGLANGDWRDFWVLVFWLDFGGDCGDSMVTSGGDRGSARAVVDKGR